MEIFVLTQAWFGDIGGESDLFQRVEIGHNGACYHLDAAKDLLFEYIDSLKEFGFNYTGPYTKEYLKHSPLHHSTAVLENERGESVFLNIHKTELI